MEALAGKLFGLFEAGEFAAARHLFAPNAILMQHFTPTYGTPVDYQQFEAGMDAMMAAIGKVQYLDRVVRPFEGGFVEQHTTRLTAPDQVVTELKVCLVITVDSALKILTIEEYLDPSPLMRKPKPKARL
jgi:hypothetical protein